MPVADLVLVSSAGQRLTADMGVIPMPEHAHAGLFWREPTKRLIMPLNTGEPRKFDS